MHSLLSWSGEAPDESLVWRGWYSRYGRAEVERYDPSKGASHYVAKYVAKEAETDWDLITLDNLSPNDQLPWDLP